MPELPSPSPATGHPAVDQALEGVAHLADAPLGEHVDRLAAAHEALRSVLNTPDGDVPTER